MIEMENSSLIPSDLMTEIFARLPVKSLLRFRCVSKHWCDSIASPTLTSLHLNNFNLNQINEKLLFRFYTIEKANNNTELNINIRNIDTFNQPSLLMKFSSSYRVACIEDSLILMSNDASKELILINPSARKSLQLPTCPLSSNSSYPNTYLMTYVSKISDYKIVAIKFGRSFASLTLKDSRWLTNETNLDSKFDTNGKGILVTQGIAHWFSKDGRLICFDFDDEQFGVVGMPDARFGIIQVFVFLFDHHGSTVGMYGVFSVNFVIWVKAKDGGEKPWTKTFAGSSSSNILDFFGNKSSCWGAWLIEKKGLFYKLVDGELWSYDIRSNQKDCLGKITADNFPIGYYKESLVLC